MQIHVVKDGLQVTKLQLIECTEKNHGAAIQDIFNQIILNSTALYEYQPRTEADMQQWFAIKIKHNHPVLGCVNAAGQFAWICYLRPISG